jgi:hypothetical protein
MIAGGLVVSDDHPLVFLIFGKLPEQRFASTRILIVRNDRLLLCAIFGKVPEQGFALPYREELALARLLRLQRDSAKRKLYWALGLVRPVLTTARLPEIGSIPKLEYLHQNLAILDGGLLCP